MNLYNFALVPCPTSSQSIGLKRKERSTPASVTLAVKDNNDDVDQPNLESLIPISMVISFVVTS
jgi:hypothetical protein